MTTAKEYEAAYIQLSTIQEIKVIVNNEIRQFHQMQNSRLHVE
jgi:hypothetical protein